MLPVKTNLVIQRGSTFIKSYRRLDANQDPIPQVGYGARLHIRQTKGSDLILAGFDSVTPPAGVPAGVILLGDASGIVRLEMGAQITTTLTFNRGVYDLEIYNLTDPADVTKLIEGKVIIKAEVTR